jgi:hypothetical protein
MPGVLPRSPAWPRLPFVRHFVIRHSSPSIAGVHGFGTIVES